MATDSDNACPICQETLHGPQSVGCTVPCGHLFHRKCFETWQVHSSATQKCPCCMVKMRGFIDKIHITLPAVAPVHNDDNSSNLMEEPSIVRQRRKALTREKAKRSAMMRHSDRRLVGRFANLEANLNSSVSNATDETRNDSSTKIPDNKPWRGAAAVASAQANMSLSASLQRIPCDPVKRAKMEDLIFEKDDHEKLDKLDKTCMMQRRNLADASFSDADDLGDPIPDVAGSIWRSIEQSIETLQPKRRHHKHGRQGQNRKYI